MASHSRLCLRALLLLPVSIFASGCVVLVPFIESDRQEPSRGESRLGAHYFVEPAARDAAAHVLPSADRIAGASSASAAAAPVPRASQPSSAPVSKESRISVLMRLLREGSEVERTHAASDLGFMGPSAREALDVLAYALKNDSCKWVRRAAAKSLGKIGSRDAVPALTAALGDREKWVAHSAGNALAKLSR